MKDLDTKLNKLTDRDLNTMLVFYLGDSYTVWEEYPVIHVKQPIKGTHLTVAKDGYGYTRVTALHDDGTEEHILNESPDATFHALLESIDYTTEGVLDAENTLDEAEIQTMAHKWKLAHPDVDEATVAVRLQTLQTLAERLLSSKWSTVDPDVWLDGGCGWDSPLCAIDKDMLALLLG